MTGASLRVFRGGCWYNGAGLCRAARHYRIDPAHRSHDLGFRPARRVRCVTS